MGSTQASQPAWELVRSVRSHWEAEVLQGFLESNGVRAVVQPHEGVGTPPHALVPAGYGVLVRLDDLHTARELVAAGGMALLDGQPEVCRARLVDLLLDLLSFPSETRAEAALADWLVERYERANEPVRRVGRSVVVGTEDDARPNVLLVAHLDTAPATGADREPHRDGDAIIGRGASDAKSGLAVAMDCFDDLSLRAGPYNLLLVAHAAGCAPARARELPRVLDEVEDLADAELAVVLDPTDLAVRLGALGRIGADVIVRGRSAHPARPWEGENALTRAGALLAALHRREPRSVTVDGLRFTESVTATGIELPAPQPGIPSRCVVRLECFFAPGRRAVDVEEELERLVGAEGELALTDVAPAVAPDTGPPLVQRFLEVVDAPVAAANDHSAAAALAQAGVPTVQFGPGVSAQVRTAGERVPVGNLVAARNGLAGFLAAGRPA